VRVIAVVVVVNVVMNFDFRILRVLCDKVRLSPDLDLRHLAQLTPGYVGVDLRFLVTKAGQICIKRSVHFLCILMSSHSLIYFIFWHNLVIYSALIDYWILVCCL